MCLCVRVLEEWNILITHTKEGFNLTVFTEKPDAEGSYNKGVKKSQ